MQSRCSPFSPWNVTVAWRVGPSIVPVTVSGGTAARLVEHVLQLVDRGVRLARVEHRALLGAVERRGGLVVLEAGEPPAERRVAGAALEREAPRWRRSWARAGARQVAPARAVASAAPSARTPAILSPPTPASNVRGARCHPRQVLDRRLGLTSVIAVIVGSIALAGGSRSSIAKDPDKTADESTVTAAPTPCVEVADAYGTAPDGFTYEKVDEATRAKTVKALNLNESAGPVDMRAARREGLTLGTLDGFRAATPAATEGARHDRGDGRGAGDKKPGYAVIPLAGGSVVAVGVRGCQAVLISASDPRRCRFLPTRSSLQPRAVRRCDSIPTDPRATSRRGATARARRSPGSPSDPSAGPHRASASGSATARSRRSAA